MLFGYLVDLGKLNTSPSEGSIRESLQERNGTEVWGKKKKERIEKMGEQKKKRGYLVFPSTSPPNYFLLGTPCYCLFRHFNFCGFALVENLLATIINLCRVSDCLFSLLL
eukprot:TRINITY_DN4248_c7_g1_i1.p1 TRINITY_DN4248_c7_g1~~TRINITY_DN4248_c7_g1_i1.p1  ORF type:complete len:110 (+),score=8.84 TRINITY_DN4248_c7_g1_i1:100-429(+)